MMIGTPSALHSAVTRLRPILLISFIIKIILTIQVVVLELIVATDHSPTTNHYRHPAISCDRCPRLKTDDSPMFSLTS